MPRQLAIFLSSLLIFGMIQLGCQVRDQSPKTITNTPKTITNSIGMELALIPKGKFQMGSRFFEAGADDDEARHLVIISKDYYLGVTEVTQGQYEKVMGTNPSAFKNQSSYPVERVTWEEAVEFCKKLSELPEETAAGRVYRLPTEAEWEYACRAGSKTAYSFGESSESLYAWFGDNSSGMTHFAGGWSPNAWGLHDMHGNVSEWCSDFYDDYPRSGVRDPVGPSRGVDRVYRGGGCFDGAASCRSANRSWGYPSSRGNGLIGFRVALSPSGIPK